MNLPYVAIGLALIFLIRPLSGWIALSGTNLTKPHRAIVSFYGIRGIGSIYYLSYAAGQIEFMDERRGATAPIVNSGTVGFDRVTPLSSLARRAASGLAG